MANNNPFKPKPIVDVNLVSDFGGIEDEAAFRKEGVSQYDYTYVPGFSGMRVKRDLDLGALARNEIRAKEVSTLPVNLHWYRRVRHGGSEPDQMRLAHARNLKYRAVTQKDIGQPWLTELPPCARIAADGTIESSGGDLALFMIDREGAARNAIRRKIAIEETMTGMEFQVGGLGEVGAHHTGASPTVEKKIGGSTK